MTTYPITLVNPGAELGNTSGWTLISNGASATTSSPRTGTYSFQGGAGFNETQAGMRQDVAVDPSMYSMIDDGLLMLFGSGWHRNTDGSDWGYIEISMYDGSGTLLSTVTSSNHNGSTYTQKTVNGPVPAGTRTVRLRIQMVNGDASIGSANQWDDLEMWFDDTPAVSINEYQMGAYALGQEPAAGASSSQLGAQVAASAETSSGLFEVYTHELGAYALVRGQPDRRDLRAWTFTQDEHDFYVIQLNDTYTLVYDKLTGQWAYWKSPEYNYWRAVDGVGWEGMNIACDARTGKLWQIDPEGRLDYETTPITSVVTGGLPLRERKVVPCYDAELSVSDGQFASSIPEGTVGISLRTSDDGGLNWYEHGEIAGGAFGDATLIRWYGLGTMDAPGRIFEITDSGYARRIDGLNVELGFYGG